MKQLRDESFLVNTYFWPKNFSWLESSSQQNFVAENFLGTKQLVD